MNENAFRLQLQSGPEAGRVYELTTDSLTLGRYPLADIVIDDPTVSYRHALLTRGVDTYRIADLGSESGTYVNGQRIGADPVALSSGDVILLGSRLSAAFLSGPIMTATVDMEERAPSPGEGLASETTSEQAYDMEAGPSSDHDDDDNDSTVREEEEPAAEMVEPVSASRQPALVMAGEQATSGHAGPLPAMPPPQKNRNGRIMLIAAGCLLALLACCCSSTLFMYFIGGDWLLSQLRYLP